jgi:hypothetical protein
MKVRVSIDNEYRDCRRKEPEEQSLLLGTLNFGQNNSLRLRVKAIEYVHIC